MIRDPEAFENLLSQFRRLLQEHLVPNEPILAESNDIPDHVQLAMRSAGVFGLSIPPKFGGLGLSFEEECRAMFVLGQTCSGYRALYSLNVGGGSQGIIHYGTEAQRALYLPRLASGEIIAAFAVTEPQAGSDASAIAMRAHRKDGGFVLDGVKAYVGNAPAADLFVVIANVVSEDGRIEGPTMFAVECQTAGLRVGPAQAKLGLDGAQIATVTFEGCRVQADAVIGSIGSGLKIALRSIDKARLHVAAVCTAISNRMLSDALSYACRRRQFGQPIAGFQMVQSMLAESRAELLAAEALVVATARLMDEGGRHSENVACAKLFASEMACRIADRCLQIHGGAGYLRENSIERFYRDVRVFRIIDGTSQIQQLIIAREMIDKFEKGST